MRRLLSSPKILFIEFSSSSHVSLAKNVWCSEIASELLAEKIIPLLVSFGQSSDYTKCLNYMVWSSVLSVHFKVTVAELVLC